MFWRTFLLNFHGIQPKSYSFAMHLLPILLVKTVVFQYELQYELQYLQIRYVMLFKPPFITGQWLYVLVHTELQTTSNYINLFWRRQSYSWWKLDSSANLWTCSNLQVVFLTFCWYRENLHSGLWNNAKFYIVIKCVTITAEPV